MTKIAFACVGNAGRSQMATAYAERERDRRGLDVELVTGGTDPKVSISEDALEALEEDGLDVGGRTPRRIESDDVADADTVVTMGCSAAEFVPEDWDGEVRIWSLESHGDGIEDTREQRDEIERRVTALFDDLERAA
ncbi:low molecular weight phosphatase family protein [Natronococcus sp. A-GB1]|uniref:arsenate-mycothiol transferase ArsC n=1 Tax=Natronococcus sp. A-GB1 TaxID=3037648 RepID=UPI00241D8FED|nr:low molecular weight phosphatase family protein [Natronococcus sp. A-GB1]MDG5758988.1 low molecular weight phosphatase family protein [Natronococcus sp. A-GB1]